MKGNPFHSKGRPMFSGDPLTGLTHGVQCSETRELRLSHAIFSIVPCTWVRLSLSILYKHDLLLPELLQLGPIASHLLMSLQSLTKLLHCFYFICFDYREDKHSHQHWSLR